MRRPTILIALVALALLAAAPAAAFDAGIFVESNFLGIGTSSPSTPLHLEVAAAPAQFLFTTPPASWNFRVAGNGNFQVSKLGTGPELNLTTAGNLIISGSISSKDCAPCVSDYVFEGEHDLMPLDELEEFVWREKHLPNVPSQKDVDRVGHINLTEMQMAMLEKIEELVLYTIEQQKLIDELNARLAAVESD